MQEINTDKDLNDLNNDIDLRELFYVLLEGKWITISLTALVSIIAVIYSLFLPNIYESKALLTPVNSSTSISGNLGGYSSLAGLAGINLPSSVEEGNSKKAMKKISSLSFFENNILPNIDLPNLMAVKAWDSKTNSLVYDKNIYDAKSGAWTRNNSYYQQKTPSAQQSYRAFISQHLRLSQDKNSGFITLSVRHQSPFVAKQWVELIVNEINSFYRNKDKLDSESAASYLNQKISMTDISEIKQNFAEILQEQTKKLALIEANQFYVFDYIDPPAVMEVKSEPQRALICILSALLGGILSFVIVLFKHYVIKKDGHIGS